MLLERGLAGASVDEIAGLARAGKPTIYARFPSKEALFTAVVMRDVRDVDAGIARFEGHVPIGATIDERLASVAVAILNWALAGHTVDLARLVIAEARWFPGLASHVYGMVRAHAAEAVARLLGEAAQPNELGTLPAFAPDRLATTTRFFLDLVLLPLFMRALHGERLKALRAEIGPHVTRSVAFFFQRAGTASVEWGSPDRR